MNDKEYIARRGKAAYEKRKAQTRAWDKTHLQEKRAIAKTYREEHPEVIVMINREHCRKEGKYYKKTLIYNRTGLQGERHRVRALDRKKWRKYKRIIAPWSQLHHEWIFGTAGYRGLALVEADKHMHGVVDVIGILEGKITLFREGEVRNEKR